MKGLERDGKMNAGVEISTRETRREKSGGAPKLSVHMKDMEVSLLLAIKSHTSVSNSCDRSQRCNSSS